MLNLIPIKEEKVIRFELNKKNINDQGIIVTNDILLLGGTLIDVKNLFYEKEKELELEKAKLVNSKLEISKQQEVIGYQDKLIVKKEKEINCKSLIINNKESLIKKKEKEIHLKEDELRINHYGLEVHSFKEI